MDSMSALGLEMDELDSFMDKMAKTAQKSNTSVILIFLPTINRAKSVKSKNSNLVN